MSSEINRRKKHLESVRVVAIKKSTSPYSPPLASAGRTRQSWVFTTSAHTGLLTHEVDEGSPCTKCVEGECPGFSLHFWRKVCKHCLHTRDDHDIKDEENLRSVTVGKILFAPDVTFSGSPASSPALPRANKARSPLTQTQSTSDMDSPSTLKREKDYLWVPKNVTKLVAEKFVLSLPKDKRPVRGTPGERYRNHQLMRQLPVYDIDIGHMRSELNTDEEKQMELFLKLRRDNALGRGRVREKECHEALEVGDIAVFGASEECWHPGCFSCYHCNELLIDLIYFVHESKVYCGRHHAELIKPRCAGCDELILCREYTRAEEKDWHLHHFTCIACDTSLGGQRYVVHDENTYCLHCNDKYFAKTCEKCGKYIRAEENAIQYQELHWHASKSCFFCCVCKKNLVDCPFLPKKGLLLCSKECSKRAKEKGLFA